MLNVVCLKTGAAYGAEYVLRLRSMVARHLPVPHRFLCFTDAEVAGVTCLRPPCHYPGWWGKVGFFRADLPVEGPMLYLDLDVLVVGPLAELIDIDAEFATIAQWKRIRAPKTVPRYNSSALYFARPGVRRQVWERFTPEAMARFRGDQDWLAWVCPNEATWPRVWFAGVQPFPDGLPPCAKVILCNDVENHIAAERWPWVKAAWT